MGERGGTYRILVGKPEGKRPRRKWEDDIRTDLQEVGWEGGMDWIDLAHDRGRWRALLNGFHKMWGIS